MPKEFNVTGTCIREKHYMVDISNKVSHIVEMINKGKYFTINRPRQYGKTTIMYEITKSLSNIYNVINTSFEGVGDDIFATEEKFCSAIFDILQGV